MGKEVKGPSIQSLKGVGPKTVTLLNRLGIHSVRDAMFHFPMRYEDRTSVSKIASLVPETISSVKGTVIGADLKDLSGRGAKLFKTPRRRGRTLFELTVTDGSGVIKGIWFNQPFMQKRFKQGQEVVLSGKVKATPWGLQIDNPDYEFDEVSEEEHVHTSRIVPVYRTTEGLSTRQLRAIISTVLKSYLNSLNDPMPQEMLARLDMPGLRESVQYTHYPPDELALDALNNWRTPYQRRLSFTELFMLEAGFAVLRKDRQRAAGICFDNRGDLVERLLEGLPFQLTGAQRKAYYEGILPDMKSPYAMNRLLQGDVGSGKTVVALMALLTAVESGYQAALMAPTEILAEQHYMGIHKLVEDLGIKVCLLTGSTKDRPLQELKDGAIEIAIGTHALIQEGVTFKRLGMAVIDEQHRFGVMQRAELRKKGIAPDVLIMTATPIPRTLSMAVYGDLDVSIINELPPGRTPVKTELAMVEEKARVYEALREEVAAGGQAYVVYPLIEESEKVDLRSAVQGYEALEKMFPAARIALLHGRMKPSEKEATMASFKSGDIDILVSTTVIEVGVDVPNASLMVIVHAERFGLSQLHQLRGRVGRGRRRSRCVLLAYGPIGQEAHARLNVMCLTNDGFRIAEEDLRLRGPGELIGTRQSGLPELMIADIIRDGPVLELARQEAFALIDVDPDLERYPALRASLESFWQGRIELFKTG